jgi:hypothetical protein
MNKQEAVGKINKIGKVGKILARICVVFLIIGMVGSLIGAIILSALPKDLFEMNVSGTGKMEIKLDRMLEDQEMDALVTAIDNGELNVGSDSYSSEGVEFSNDGKTLLVDISGSSTVVNTGRVALVLWCTLGYLAATLVVMIFVEKLCKAFRDCKTPFEESIIVGLQRLAWSLIPWMFLGSIFQGFIDTAFRENVNVFAGISLEMALVILLIFGLSFIFKYGAVLQQESDETL